MNGVGVLCDRFTRGLLAMAVVGVGAAMLCWPARLEAHDRWGFQISCGSGLTADDGQAAIATADAGVDYVGRCRSALRQRRVWAVALVTLGGVGAVVNAWPVQRRRRPAPEVAT